MNRTTFKILAAASLLITGACVPAQDVTDAGALDRTVLPIAEPDYPAITELDARNAEAPAPFAVEAPDGAPNVVVVLIDDIGFGTAGMFGGAIETPTLDRLAQGGLRYNQFHTTALCSPTRIDLTPRLVPRSISVIRCCDRSPKTVPVRGLGFGVPQPPVASPWRTP